jgi:hypothetical protein
MYLVLSGDQLHNKLAVVRRGPSFFTSRRIDSSRWGIIPNDLTSPPQSATATAMVSAWTSNTTVL